MSVVIFVFLGWILSVCLHEFGHALVAYWGGDTSVKDKGYLTLNPLKYTDINLSLTLPLIFLLMGGIALPGAAVYVNHQNLRNRWWQSAVSAAGPVTSAIVTLLLAMPFKLGLVSWNTQYQQLGSGLAFLIYLEIYVTIINSLPIPSLDGYGVIEPWLPSEFQLRLRRFSQSALLFLFTLLWFVKPIGRFLGDLSTSIAQTLGVPVEMIGVGSALFNRLSGILLIATIGIIFIIRRLTRKPQEVWFERGQAFSKSGQYEKAIAAYNRAIQIQPDNPTIWTNKGVLLGHLQRYEEAIAACDRAIDINPKYTLAWYNKAGCYAEQNQVDLAIEHLKQALALDSKKVREYAKTDSSFDVVRENPLFKQLIGE